MTPEGTVKAQIRKFLKERKVWFCCPATGGFLVCYKGRLIAIEAKRPGGKPTKLQIDAITAINASGGIAFVYDGEGGVSALANLFDSIGVVDVMDAMDIAVEVCNAERLQKRVREVPR
jgi:hypothetical protein